MAVSNKSLIRSKATLTDKGADQWAHHLGWQLRYAIGNGERCPVCPDSRNEPCPWWPEFTNPKRD